MTARKIGRPRIKHWPHERSVRFNDVQHERLERAADQLEMPVAAVVRELVDEDLPRLVRRRKERERRKAKAALLGIE